MLKAGEKAPLGSGGPGNATVPALWCIRSVSHLLKPAGLSSYSLLVDVCSSNLKAFSPSKINLAGFYRHPMDTRSRYKYDVFLSFRGEDTRKNFVDHLHHALNKKGITTFRDDSDRDLPRGKAISLELTRAIDESRYVLVIFSENYASSTWCLQEVAKIVECKGTSAESVIPIFYKVNPSDIRKIKGTFKEHFAKHERDFKDNSQMLENWKDALNTVASLSGEELKDEYESEFIQKIVKQIENRLGSRFSYVADKLVGIESRVAKVVEQLCLCANDVRIIGIWGMGGIGKTTTVRAVYDSIRNQFDGSSFLANVREVSEKIGLVNVQNQLLHEILEDNDLSVRDIDRGANMIKERLKYKRVIVVLDDVDEAIQLKRLAGGSDWFGHGSRIIITTRDENMLKQYWGSYSYKAERLTNEEALELFSLKAFNSNCPPGEFKLLSQRVVDYADGLPLALDVLGSFLFGRELKQWQSTLARLEECPNEEIFGKLKISYDALEEKDKEIFLDLACFFKGNEKARVMEILESCDLHPDIGIQVLIERSLITVEGNTLQMHDLLQEMGWEIVYRESPEEPGERSRIWQLGDLLHILAQKSGSPRVKGIVLQSDDLWLMHKCQEHLEFLNRRSIEGTCMTVGKGLSFLKARRKELVKLLQSLANLSGESFTKMTNLRLLCVGTIHLSSGFKDIPNELRLLTWEYCNLKSFPPSFLPEKLVALNMHHSFMRKLWTRKKVQAFQELKVMDLSHSEFFIKTPNFECVPNLNRLILKGCKGLRWLHPSIGVLKELTLLDLSGCDNLESLPDSVGHLSSLRVLNLSGCSNLDKLHENIGLLKCLEELDISGTSITHTPPELAALEKLKIVRSHQGKLEGRPPRFMQRSKKDRLGPRSFNGANNLVGIQHNIDTVISILRLGESDVHTIGIVGMGGIGKTTIAQMVYGRIHGQFEGSSFLYNVREVLAEQNGLMHLQNQLLEDVLKDNSLSIDNVHEGASKIKELLQNKKVVLVLDDVDGLVPLEYLVGDVNWFGQGSRIIVTTRDMQMLRRYGVNVIFKVQVLCCDAALELFRSQAFRSDSYYSREFDSLTKMVVMFCCGHPLVVNVLGSYLHGRDLAQWKNALERLELCREYEIFDLLRISYDGLEENEKAIFLDIACFFKGKDWRYVTEIMEVCGFNPKIGIQILIDKCLITIENDKLWMHDLLQEMAQQIVHLESPDEPGKRSRIWRFEDLYHILMNNSGTEKLEGVILKDGYRGVVNANGESFTNMTNLRLLDIHSMHLTSGIEHLSNKLCILTLDDHSLELFPPNFYPKNLLELNMRNSLLKKLWTGERVFEKLKAMDLSGSKSLVVTPNFRDVPNLESLILKGCKALYQVHTSIEVLERLNIFDLSDCENLITLPEGVCNLRSLEVLNLSGCSNLVELPENISSLTRLQELDISGTLILHLPSSSIFVKNLKRFRKSYPWLLREKLGRTAKRKQRE